MWEVGDENYKELGYKSEIFIHSLISNFYELVHGAFKSTGFGVRLPVFVFWIWNLSIGENHLSSSFFHRFICLFVYLFVYL